MDATETEPLTMFRFLLDKGHEAMEAGHAAEATLQFRTAAAYSESVEEEAEAHQMVQRALRMQGQLNKAKEHGLASLRLLCGDDSQKQPAARLLLIAQARRDFSETLRLHGLIMKVGGDHIAALYALEDARRELQTSIQLHKQIIEDGPLDKSAIEASMATTNGALGLLLFAISALRHRLDERGGYTQQTHSNAREGRKKAVALIASSRYHLHQEKYALEEAEHLVRLMRVSGVLGRLDLIDDAFDLTAPSSKASGARKNVWIALLGGDYLASRLEIRRAQRHH